MEHTYNAEKLGTTDHNLGYYHPGAHEIYMNMASNGTHKDITVY